MAEHELLIRDPRTLDLIGILGDYASATWTRRTTAAGEFEIAVHNEQLSKLALVDEDNIFEVRRDGAYEFGGVLEHPQHDAITGMWTLEGPDLKGFWLRNRETNPGGSEFDAQVAVTAEAALNHYVEDHLTAPSDSTRDVNAELDGLVFTTEGGSGRGTTINYNARWQNLLEVLEDIAGAPVVDLWYDVVMVAGGYQFQIYDHVDASEGETDAVVFSASFDNVSEATYEKDVTRLVNAVYVLGPGSGASRTVLEVKDPTEIANHFRREGHIDSRQADSADIRTEEGNREIARSILAMQATHVQPLITAIEQYRTHWDLGYDVTLAFPSIGQTLDQRIVAVTVTLSDEGEEVHVEFDHPPTEITALLAALLKRSHRVQVA